MKRVSLKLFLLVALIVGSGVGFFTKWHIDSSNQYSALQRIAFHCVDAADGSNCYEAFLDDETGVDENGMLIFTGREHSDEKQDRVLSCGFSFDRRYYCESPLVWVYETTEPIANEIRQLKGVRQIVVWDEDTENGTNVWQEWVPSVRVVNPGDLGYVDRN